MEKATKVSIAQLVGIYFATSCVVLVCMCICQFVLKMLGIIRTFPLSAEILGSFVQVTLMLFAITVLLGVPFVRAGFNRWLSYQIGFVMIAVITGGRNITANASFQFAASGMLVLVSCLLFCYVISRIVGDRLFAWLEKAD